MPYKPAPYLAVGIKLPVVGHLAGATKSKPLLVRAQVQGGLLCGPANTAQAFVRHGRLKVVFT